MDLNYFFLSIWFEGEEHKSEGVWEQGIEENIWTEERWSDTRLEKTA
jgi:hypothetical protein